MVSKRSDVKKEAHNLLSPLLLEVGTGRPEIRRERDER